MTNKLFSVLALAVYVMTSSTPVTADGGLRLLSQSNPTSGNGIVDAEERKRILETAVVEHAHRELGSSKDKKDSKNSKGGKNSKDSKGGKNSKDSKGGSKDSKGVSKNSKGGSKNSKGGSKNSKGGSKDSKGVSKNSKGGSKNSKDSKGASKNSKGGSKDSKGVSKKSKGGSKDSKDSKSKKGFEGGDKKIRRKKTKKEKNRRRSRKGSKKSLKSKKKKRSKKAKKAKTKKQADATRIPGQCVADHMCASITGDPHITTFSGMKYDCQGAGEFVLIKSLTSPLEVQARFHQGRVAGEGKKAISITQGISIDEGVEGSPQLDVFVSETNGQCDLNIYINGELATDFGPLGMKYPGIEFMPDVDVGADFLDYVFFTGSALLFTTSVKMGSFGCVLNSKFCLPPDIVTNEKVVGLLGSPNGPDWMSTSGVKIDSSNHEWKPAYDYCVNNWCVETPGESIFGYEPGTDHSTFNFCADAYNPTAESMVEAPSAACEECCAPAATVDAYNACLLECAEGDVVDCELELFNEIVLANAERSCPEPIPQQPECHVNGDCFDGKECIRGYCLTPPEPEPEVVEFEPPSPDDRNGPEDDVSPDDKSTDKAFTKGDPHFKTFGGELYDFHGECDLILLDNPDFKEGLGMQIQIRTKITDWWSSVEAAAVKIGEETLEIQANLESTEWMWINGQANDVLEDGKWYHARLSGFLVRFKQTMTRAGEMREANIYFEGSDKAGAKDPLVLKTFKSFVHLDVNWKGSENFNGATGLLGSQAHNGARLGRSGDLIEDINTFGQDWQVSESDAQLFHSYEDVVVAPNKCRMPEESLAKEQLRNRRLAEGMSFEQAEAACDHASAEEKDACIYDVLATQDVDMAGAW